MFMAEEPGRYRIGPFTVSQNGTEARTQATAFEIKDVEMFDGMRLRMVLPDKPVYIGQRVPIRVEWWVRASERESLLKEPSYDFSIPLFQMGSAFNFIDEPAQTEELPQLQVLPGPKARRERHRGAALLPPLLDEDRHALLEPGATAGALRAVEDGVRQLMRDDGRARRPGDPVVERQLVFSVEPNRETLVVISPE